MPESSISINHIPSIEAENSTMTRRSYHTPIEPIFFTPTYCGHYICKKEFLIEECKRAYASETTPNCREKCSACGAACFKGGLCVEKRC